MERVMIWWKASGYHWYRKEYLRTFKILYRVMACIMLVGMAIGYITLNREILTVTFMLLFCCVGVVFTLRSVDEHERKLANK